MGTNSTQGWAIAVFLVAFTLLAGAFAAGGNVLLLSLFLICAGVSVTLFLKAKSMEQRGEVPETSPVTGSAQREIGAARG